LIFQIRARSIEGYTEGCFVSHKRTWHALCTEIFTKGSLKINVPGTFSIFEGFTPFPLPLPPNESVPPKNVDFTLVFRMSDLNFDFQTPPPLHPSQPLPHHLTHVGHSGR